MGLLTQSVITFHFRFMETTQCPVLVLLPENEILIVKLKNPSKYPIFHI